MRRALNTVKARRRYLIQQGISLARIGGRPIDYRVKVVKNGDVWEFRSMVGRLARPGLFVTNLCKGERCYHVVKDFVDRCRGLKLQRRKQKCGD